MTWAAFAFIMIGVLLNATAQYCLKAGVNRLGVIGLQFHTLVRDGLVLAVNPWILAGLCCYVVSVIVWIIALSRTAVSIAYPMVSIGYIVTAVAAWAFLGEHLSVTRWLGIGVIILGVFLVWKS
jgi:drug/metabolite transporter (DMT)-like permease